MRRRRVENQKGKDGGQEMEGQIEEKGKTKERGSNRQFAAAHKCWFS